MGIKIMISIIPVISINILDLQFTLLRIQRSVKNDRIRKAVNDCVRIIVAPDPNNRSDLNCLILNSLTEKSFQYKRRMKLNKDTEAIRLLSPNGILILYFNRKPCSIYKETN